MPPTVCIDSLGNTSCCSCCRRSGSLSFRSPDICCMKNDANIADMRQLLAVSRSATCFMRLVITSCSAVQQKGARAAPRYLGMSLRIQSRKTLPKFHIHVSVCSGFLPLLPKILVRSAQALATLIITSRVCLSFVRSFVHSVRNFGAKYLGNQAR